MNRTKYFRRKGRWTRGAGTLVLLAGLVSISPLTGRLQGQIVLDGPNLAGTVGLNGQTFGSADVYLSWQGGNVQTRLVNGDQDFSVRVEPGKVLSATVYMYSFQGGTNANVYQNFSNIIGPTATATSPLQLTLSRDAGRILGRVSVTGGSVSRVAINAYKQVSANEYQQGNATATSTPFDAILPFSAQTGVTVQGSAVLRAESGCEVPVSLANKSVDVSAGADVTASWSFDLTTELCNQGGIQGQIVVNGLAGVNADAVIQQRSVSASGPVGRSQTTDAAGSYAFSSLPPGTYYLSNTNYFASPYTYFGTPSDPVAVAAGSLVTKDMIHDVGTAHVAIRPKGAWSLASVQDMWTSWSSYSPTGTYLGYSGDRPTLASGAVDVVAPASTLRLDYYYAYFFKNDGTRYSYQYFYDHFFNGVHPVQAAVVAGGRHDLGLYEPESSEAEQVVQLANTSVGLTSLRLTGSHSVIESGRQVGSRSIDLYDYALTSTPGSSAKVLVRGRPGTYKMMAVGQGTDGATYSKPFDLVLGAPQNTPAGTDVVMPISIAGGTTGTTTGSITFGNVIATGETTISASESGPNPRQGFAVVGSGVRTFFDIRTTATFDPDAGATLCLSYDDTGLTVSQESRLTLEHYVCSGAGSTNCGWEDITAAGSPNTTTNTICGVTGSFSIFAIMRPLDGDGDGVSDALDNCPAVANADQADLDRDGIGNVCDSDIDGDSVPDSVDTCPTVASPNQTDTDGDGIGDVCDPDVDGDSVVNGSDNCPANANTNQSDFDDDGIGDACDPDDDNDGVADSGDLCAGTTAGALIEPSGCSSPQSLQLACPTNASWRNHGAYVQCVAQEAERQVAEGVIPASEKDAIVATAAKSEIGKK
jgi:hypothetical protein